MYKLQEIRELKEMMNKEKDEIMKNDCGIFFNTCEMLESCLEGIKKCEGWAITTLTHESMKLYNSLETMYYRNYAVRQYRNKVRR